MDKASQDSSCMCEGREFVNLARVCQKTACYICKNGTWERDDRIPVL
jgi:hypothetical protein